MTAMLSATSPIDPPAGGSGAQGLRLIAYLWVPRERQPRREVIIVSSLDDGRATIRRMFVDFDAALRAELWDEDRLVARLRTDASPGQR